jgi:hypothetical protein
VFTERAIDSVPALPNQDLRTAILPAREANNPTHELSFLGSFLRLYTVYCEHAKSYLSDSAYVQCHHYAVMILFDVIGYSLILLPVAL